MSAGIWRYVSRFFAWWFGELRACVPNALAGLLFGVTEELEVSLDADGACFTALRDGARRELGRLDDNAANQARLRKAVRRLLGRRIASTGRVTLRLPASQVLRPKVELPIAAAENLREVLELEMDRHTPFAPGDVLFDFRVAGSDAELERLNVDLLVARKRDVDAALAGAEAMGLTPNRVTGPGRTAGDPPFNLMPHRNRPRAGRVVRRLNLAAAACALALAAVAFQMWLERKERALEALEARVAALRASMGEAGRLEEKAAQLLAVSGYVVDRKRSRPGMIEIIDEVTRLLPDEYWLISYAYRDGSLDLMGYANDPSGVLRLLEQSDLFSGARFAAPVTMDPRIGKERFNVSVAVAPERVAQ